MQQSMTRYFSARRGGALASSNMSNHIRTNFSPKSKNSPQLHLGTFNVLGCTSKLKHNLLCEDMIRYELDILCLQETKVCSFSDDIFKGNKFIFLDSSNPHYGLGFIIGVKCPFELIYVKSISDRIAYIQFKTPDSKLLTIINIYAPHMAKPEAEKKDSYSNLDRLCKDITDDDNLIMIAGDFNAKIGAPSQLHSDLARFRKSPPFCGFYSRGIRNSNGDLLASFCTKFNFYLTNTHFPHKARHMTTWSKRHTSNFIYNQIDFILIPQCLKHTLLKARSYGGMYSKSDHKLVKCQLQIVQLFKRKSIRTIYRKRTPKRQKIDIGKLNDVVIANKYYNQVAQNIRSFKEGKDYISCHELVQSINSASETCLGYIDRDSRPPMDPRMETLVIQRRKIQHELDTLKFHSDDQFQSRKSQLKQLQNKIKSTSLTIWREDFEQKCDEVEDRFKNNMHRAGFALIKRMKNVKGLKIQLSHNGATIMDNQHKLQQMRTYYSSVFDSTDSKIIQALPKNTSLQLINPIRSWEVSEAIKKLNNGRSPGPTNIVSEQYKAANGVIAKEIAAMINNNNFDDELGSGIVVAIPKPGKPRNVANLRPITLLNNIRKILSLVILQRIRSKVEQFISPSQSAFRRNRSTGDAVWAHKFIVAKAYKYQWTINILGIDLSKAFDTIDRSKLLTVLESFLDEDEIKLITLLLTDTQNRIRIDSDLSDMFKATIGTPQGDGLSPILFIIYLEAALKDLRSEMLSHGVNIDEDIIYADDSDFIMESADNIDIFQQYAPDILATWSLRMNVNKTEVTRIDNMDDSWKNTKKLGTILDEEINLQFRINQTSAVFNGMWSFWKSKNKLTLKHRIRLFSTYIRSKLLYNCATWALTQTQIKKLESFDRRLLRRAIGIVYPQTISVKKLYEQTGLKPLRLYIFKTRWKLFRKIVLMEQNIHAKKWMIDYFSNDETKRRGRTKTSLPTIIHDDLQRINKSFKSIQDLEELEECATDDAVWEEMTKTIEESLIRQCRLELIL